MEEDDDDFYGGAQQTNGESAPEAPPATANAPVKAEDDGSEEEESSDDEIQITTERPEGAKSESVQPQRASSVKPTLKHDRSPSTTTAKPSKIAKAETSKSEKPASSTPAAGVKTTLTHNGREGKDFPDVRTSKLDLATSPNWPGTNKPITLLDIDADLAEHSKPWRLPGTDQTDFFNYGFDEYTWTQYCVRQQTMGSTIAQQREQDAQMKAMLGMGGDGGGGGGPPGMPPGAPPGMPDMMMQMMAGGMDPNKMDMGQFMQMMGPPGSTPQPPSGPAGFGGGSPFPQGQGFQPPSGPSGGMGGMNMDGFNPQQMAMMQEQQGPMGGGGGGRGRGRRGRGFY